MKGNTEMIKISPDLCNGCRISKVVCSLIHEGVIAPKRSKIRIRSSWLQQENISVCIAYDQKKCIEAYPHEGIHTEPSKKFPFFCDTCEEEFQCVKWCPTKAILDVE